ncbi:MAG: Maf family protein [Halanaerobiales bacterium]
MPKKIVLASASPRREELLKQLGLNFTIVPSNIDEDEYSCKNPVKLVKKLSEAKAEDVAVVVEDAIVIAADTVVVYKDEILGKPADKNEAKSMLGKLSGSEHQVYSGITVISSNNNQSITEFDRTEVYMKKLNRDEIDLYIQSGEPMGKAGSYAIQGLGGVFVDRIEGSYFSVMGLPIHLLFDILKEFNISIFS